MTPRRAFTYLAIWFFLAGYYALFERESPKADRSMPATAALVEMRAEDVRAIELSASGSSLRCVRGESGWRAVEPADAVVPTDLITALLDALVGTEPVEVVSADASRAADFGFAEPAGRIVLQAAQGDPVAILLGRRNPAKTAIYASREGSSEIVLIGLNVQYYVELALQGLRRP